MLSIADKAYLKDAGENVRIVGGCGLKLDNINSTVLVTGSVMHHLLNTAMAKLPDQQQTIQTHNGNKYSVFRINLIFNCPKHVSERLFRRRIVDKEETGFDVISGGVIARM